MTKREIEVLEMLKSLKSHLRRVRVELEFDQGPIVRSKLWKAELEVDKATDMLSQPRWVRAATNWDESAD